MKNLSACSFPKRILYSPFVAMNLAVQILSTCFMCCIFVMTVLLLQAAAEVTELRTRPCAVTH